MHIFDRTNLPGILCKLDDDLCALGVISFSLPESIFLKVFADNSTLALSVK